MKKSKKITAMDIVLLALCLLLPLGAAWIFPACGAHEDGSVMACHWAGRAVLGAGAAMGALAVLRLFLSSGAKLGADAALILFAGYGEMLPGTLISLCMMSTMRCHALMKPAVIVVCALIQLAAAADILLRIRRERAEKR